MKEVNLTSLLRTVVRTVTSLGSALRSRARPVTLAASPVTSPLPALALALRPLLPKPSWLDCKRRYVVMESRARRRRGSESEAVA